jgi:aminoglycoside phosphotransferase (APT) family kinase protein
MGIPAAEVSIDAATIRALLQAQHPDLAHLPLVPIQAGWDNSLFRLGEDLAVRLPRRALAANLILHEQRWLPLLAERVGPLKVPVPVRIGVAQLGYPWAWSIVPWIEGETSDLAPLARDQAEVLGSFFERLHRPAPSEAPLNPYRGVALAQRAEAFRAHCERLRGRSTSIDASIIEIWSEALAAPIDVAATWIHGDLHPRNVLSVRGRIEGIIDWGDLAQGDRASDLSAVWMLLPSIESRHRAIAACPTVSRATWVRAKGWAAFYAAIFLDAALHSDAGMVAMAERTIERLKTGP